ncbi:MAG: phosphotransferase family protein [Sulfuricaulis sp.]|nr:phosphotransferase family protein [Sulfuricaulis sp.]
MNPIAWDRVAAYLARFGHTLDPNFPPRQFSGGLGNWNFLVKVDARFYVLRRPPAGALPIGANDMAREHRILSHLNKVFPLAPASLLFCDDPLIIGAPFLLLEYREGIIIRDRLAENVAAGVQQRRGLAMTTLNVLAQLHGVDPHAIGLGTLGKPDGMVSRQALNWTRRAQQAYDGELPRALVEVATWLAQPAPAPQKVCLLHSDFKIDNIIFDRPTLAPVALIDWDMGTLGDPLLDVATLLSYWTERDDPPVMHELKQMPTALDGFPSRDEVLHLYAEKTGCDISDFKYYRILAMFKLCIVFRQLYAKHLRGDPVPAAYASFGGLSDGLAEFTHHTLQSKQL